MERCNFMTKRLNMPPVEVPDTDFMDNHDNVNNPSHYQGNYGMESTLSALIGRPIATITFGSQNLQSEKDRYIEEITELKKELNACYEEKVEDQQKIEHLKDRCENLFNELSGYVWDEMNLTERQKRMNRRRFAR